MLHVKFPSTTQVIPNLKQFYRHPTAPPILPQIESGRALRREAAFATCWTNL